MELHHEMIPLYEANVYLSERFSNNRTSDRIEHIKRNSTRMINNDLPFYDRIVALQNELDEYFEPDDIMRRYFTPLKTKESNAGDTPLTLGGMLLAIPADLKEPVGFDDLVDFYRRMPGEFLIEHFYISSLSACIPDKDEVAEGISGFVAAADSILSELADKWALVDAATNPYPHLEKLCPLVCSVAESIEKKSRELDEWMRNCLGEIRAYGTEGKNLKSLLGMELLPEENEKAVYYQSLFSFNIVDLKPSTHYYPCFAKENPKPEKAEGSRMRITAGIYTAALTRKNAEAGNSDTHLYLLKLLSDPMRFNVLHDMCDNYSYGLELADKYKTTRSAMYYHLEKLVSLSLIDLKSTEYRMLYTMNKRNVYDKLNALRDYLLNGWKPEEETEKSENDN